MGSGLIWGRVRLLLSLLLVPLKDRLLSGALIKAVACLEPSFEDVWGSAPHPSKGKIGVPLPMATPAHCS